MADIIIPPGIECLNKINDNNFQDIALNVFRYQYHHNTIYRQYTDALGVIPDSVKELVQIPFFPVSFYKSHIIVTQELDTYPLVFESSGTTGEMPSRHYVQDAEVYKISLLAGFKQFYGDPSGYVIIALLPSYLERKNASLVHMARVLMDESGHPACGFYLDEWEKLSATILELEKAGKPVLLLGVTFALLDFATAYPMHLKHTIVMETGGMKGRREEWTREQVHNFLKTQWHLPCIHSEYGMTELLSQAYAISDGLFLPTNSMKVLVRDINDPLDVGTQGTGCINIVDLANVHSCSFIATEDIGRIHTDSKFEVLGRMDHAALRGCSLMTA